MYVHAACIITAYRPQDCDEQVREPPLKKGRTASDDGGELLNILKTEVFEEALSQHSQDCSM